MLMTWLISFKGGQNAREHRKGHYHICVNLGMLSGDAKAQRSVLNNIKDSNDFDVIWKNTQRCTHEAPNGDSNNYWGTGNPSQQYPTYGKKCGESNKDNHLKWCAGPSRVNRWTSSLRCWMRCTRRVRLIWECWKSRTSFDVVRVKYINRNSIKFVLLTKHKLKLDQSYILNWQSSFEGDGGKTCTFCRL